jgi:hypothetical protein
VEQEIPDGYDRELHEVFLVCDATPPGDLRLQKEEVEAVFRLDLDEVEALYETGSAPAREYAEGRTSATRIHLTEFVPKDEGYLRRVAWTARQLLSGTQPDPIF